MSFAIAGSDPQIRFIDAAPAEQMVMNTINISFYSKAYLDSLRADSIARNVVVVVVDKNLMLSIQLEIVEITTMR